MIEELTVTNPFCHPKMDRDHHLHNCDESFTVVLSLSSMSSNAQE